MYQKSMLDQIEMKIFRISHVLITSQDDYLRLIQTPIPSLRYLDMESFNLQSQS